MRLLAPRRFELHGEEILMYDPGPDDSERAAVLGAAAARLQRAHRVDLRRGVSVTSLEDDAAGHVCKAHLDDGATLDIDRFDDPRHLQIEVDKVKSA